MLSHKDWAFTECCCIFNSFQVLCLITRYDLFSTAKNTIKYYQGCTQDVKSQDRDVPKNVSRPQCRSFKTLTGEVSHLTTCFVRVRSIIFFVIYSHCMHVHKTKVTRPRRYIFKTEMRPRCSIFLNSRDRDETETFHFFKLSRLRRDRDVKPSRPRRDVQRAETFQKTSRDRLETETQETRCQVRDFTSWCFKTATLRS